MENEIWKTYPEIEWLQGSNLGRVRTLDHYVKDKRLGKRLIKGHVLPQRHRKDGYMDVSCGVNGKTVHTRVNRVIAMCFLDNPNNLPQVNHKNAIRTDNRVENLEWCTHQENIAYRNKLGHQANCGRGSAPVISVNLNTHEVSRFSSQSEAARQLGAYQTIIKNVIKGKQNKHHGYWFTNADNHAVENTRAKFGDSVARKVEKLLNKED